MIYYTDIQCSADHGLTMKRMVNMDARYCCRPVIQFLPSASKTSILLLSRSISKVLLSVPFTFVDARCFLTDLHTFWNLYFMHFVLGTDHLHGKIKWISDQNTLWAHGQGEVTMSPVTKKKVGFIKTPGPMRDSVA